MNQKNKINILNYWWAANYGANLTAYALQKLIENSILVDNSDFQQYLCDSTQIFHHNFAKKYLKTSNHYIKVQDFLNLAKNSNTFIVGSDQVFRAKLNKRIAETFLLDFVDINSKKIAFSASFGVDKEKFLQENSSETIEHMKTSLKSFDFISVREKSGVEICKDIFNVDAEWIIDPVFILDKKYYENLTTQSNQNFNGKIVSCIFDKKDNKSDKFLSKKYNAEVIELWNSNLSIEEWLSAIKDCKFLITNSYHAMCFAIIFNKPFISLSKDMGASARFESLFEMLGIEDQSINNINEIYEKDCIFKIDYEKVNQRIEEERQRGLDFLKKALESPAGKKEEKIEAKMQFLENKICELEQQATLKYQIKKELWHLWLIIFHKYLPNSIKNIIRFMRNKICK